MYDIIIVGAGCAGMTAAVYALRAGCSVKMFECESLGGQISASSRVENFPSIKQISGMEFSDNLFSQATDLGVDFGFERVISVEDGEVKTVVTDGGKYECKALIIAVGLKHRSLPIENIDSYVGKGLSYCAVCDGMFFKGKDVAVVGGGNTALQDALYLSQYCSKVSLVHRRDEFRGDFALVEQLKKADNVEFVLNANVVEIISDNSISGIKVKYNNGETGIIEVSGLFCAIGQIPQNSLFEGIVKLDSDGFVYAGENCKTDKKGIFVAGDCRTKEVRQLTTAAADGAVAALAAAEYARTNA